MSSDLAIQFRDAMVADRVRVKEFVYTIHIQESVRNEIELKNQTDDLLTDFPNLVSDELFTDASSFTRLATDSEGNIVGCAGLLDEKDDPRKSKLSFFYVSRSHRRRGIGQQLLRELLVEAKQRGVKEVSLVTMREVFETAIQLYSRFGFVVVKEYPWATYTGVDMTLSMDQLQLI